MNRVNESLPYTFYPLQTCPHKASNWQSGEKSVTLEAYEL